MADGIERTPRATHYAAADLVDINTRGALVAIAIALLAIAILFGTQVFQGSSLGQGPNEDRYQAVFLTNGQVYFGKLEGLGGAYATLSDVYYIQANPQQTGQPGQATPQPGLSLVELGEEIHGPERQMQIATSQLVFWEDLKDDGQVVKGIKDKKTKGDQPAENTQQQGQPPQGGQQTPAAGATNRPATTAPR